jgi:hypothetical protein
MKNIVKYTHHLLCVVGAASLIISCKHAPKQECASRELSAMRQAVERQIQNQCRQILDQLAAFSKVVASDRDFSMKLFVENNRSAPEVTDFTQRYMEPMGFSLLELADSRQVLLSCAQFSASAGSSVAEKAALLGDRATFINENAKGQPALTLQAQLRFKILDSTLYCSGGRIVDEDFVSRLCVGSGFKVIIKEGQKFIGLNPAASVSGSTDTSITINDTTYSASSIAVPFAGQGESPVFVVVNEHAATGKR